MDGLSLPRIALPRTILYLPYLYIEKIVGEIIERDREKKYNRSRYIECSLLRAVIPVIVIFADHLLVPSIVICLACSIESMCVSGSTPNVVLSAAGTGNNNKLHRTDDTDNVRESLQQVAIPTPFPNCTVWSGHSNYSVKLTE